MPGDANNDVLHELMGLVREVKDETKGTLKDVQSDLKSLNKEVISVKIELAVLKSKAAMWGAAASLVVSALVSGVAKLLIGHFTGG